MQTATAEQVSYGGVSAQTGSRGKGRPLRADSPTLSPAWHWEEQDSLLTWEDVDVLVPVHVRR